MKKLFCLFIFGVMGLSVFYLSVHQKHPAHARVAPIQKDSFKPCLSAGFDSQSGVHRAGTGLGPVPRSDQDYHSIPIQDFNLPNQQPRARGSSTDQQSADTDAGDTVTSEDGPQARARGTELNPMSMARAVSLKGAIWQRSHTVTQETGNKLILKVRFLDGTAAEKARVKSVAPEWSKHTNVRFEFVQSEPADIRIGFDPTDGHWSYVGIGAKYSDKPMKKTMNLAAVLGDRYTDAVILHEFGHALGLSHEHQHPGFSVQWNEPVVLQEVKEDQGWSETQIRRNVLNRLNVSSTNFTAFDRRSIMLYPIPNRWTIGDFESPYNETLSATDKQFIGKLYPKPKSVSPSPSPPPSTKPVAHIARVWADHNVRQNSRKGMRIHVQFRVDNFKSKSGIVVGFFYFRSGKVLKDFNGRYRTQSGTVAVAGNFRPGYRNTIYSDYTLFMPYNELHLKRGMKHRLKCVVALGLGNKLGDSSEYHFYVTK